MFKTLLMKEIRETLISWQFAISAFVVVILVPLGLILSLDEYQKRLTVYQNAIDAYEQKIKIDVDSGFTAEGYRPPSPLSVLVTGLDPILPNSARTLSDLSMFVDDVPVEGKIVIKNISQLDNPYTALFGTMDFMFIISVIMSMLAFVYTYAGIAGEKELGTLKHILANPVSRWTVLSAKITGTFFIYLLPFIAACLLGGIVLNVSHVFNLAEPGIVQSILAIMAVSSVFLFCMFSLGMLVSAMCRNAVTAFISLLFVWILLALVIPKLSPMLAQKIHPVIGKDVLDRRIDAVITDISNKMKSREDDLFAGILEAHGVTFEEFDAITMNTNGNRMWLLDSDIRSMILTEFDDNVGHIRSEYTERLFSETERLTRDYDNEFAVQQSIAQQLSRISPVSCLTYILTSLASTGPWEDDVFTEYANRLRNEYDRFMNKHIIATRRGTFSLGFGWIPVDENTLVPHLEDYSHASLIEAYKRCWPDVLLLFLYTLLFFAGSFVIFIRYDVR